VGTGSHAVELTRIQPAGKKMMAAADWARGMASLESVVFE
jgi:methionyl-tRNA formyltransferase